MDYLEKTKFSLNEIKQHLGQNQNKSVLVESYLVQYLLVCLYSEIENTLVKIIRNRLHFAGDQKLQNFVYNTNEAMIKRAKTGDIRTFVEKFGCDKETCFQSITAKELGVYGSALANRHAVSHAEGVSLTLEEFEQALIAAEKILVTVESIIK